MAPAPDPEARRSLILLPLRSDAAGRFCLEKLARRTQSKSNGGLYSRIPCLAGKIQGISIDSGATWLDTAALTN